MRKYELMFIVRPDVPEEELEKLITQMSSVAAGAGGKVEKVEKMGRRRLAYRVRKQREGFYVLFNLEGSGDTLKELERRLKVTDSVLKYITIRVDEESKRAEKLQAERAKAEAKRPRSKPASSGPGGGSATPAAPQPGAETAQA